MTDGAEGADAQDREPIDEDDGDDHTEPREDDVSMTLTVAEARSIRSVLRTLSGERFPGTTKRRIYDRISKLDDALESVDETEEDLRDEYEVGPGGGGDMAGFLEDWQEVTQEEVEISSGIEPLDFSLIGDRETEADLSVLFKHGLLETDDENE